MNSAFCPLPPSHRSLIMMLRDQLLKNMNLSLTGITSSESVSHQFSRSVVSDSLRPHGLQRARLPYPSPTPRACSILMSIKSVVSSNHLILCHPLLFLPSIFPSIRVFSNESVLHLRLPKYWISYAKAFFLNSPFWIWHAYVMLIILWGDNSQRKIAPDGIKQPRKTLFKTIAVQREIDFSSLETKDRQFLGTQVCCLVAESCPTLCDTMDCSLPGSSVHGIFQVRILEWVAIPFSRWSSQWKDQTRVSLIVGRFFTVWATRELMLSSLIDVKLLPSQRNCERWALSFLIISKEIIPGPRESQS